MVDRSAYAAIAPAMEDLLAQEHAAEQHVLALLKQPDEPIAALLDAFVTYRQLCLTTILADFRNVSYFETRLWQAHCAGKNYFHVALASLRKRQTAQQPQLPVETRKLMQLYLGFIKKSQVFYRDYIFKLSTSSIGVPELEAVAQMKDKMKDKNSSAGESPLLYLTPEFRGQVLQSAHQTLIYLGDLSRWRASEQLDKEPDFRPAIGYYGLAATLMPASGMGHHQQAVVELEQRRHLYAIYHLYRALVVANPHPNAANNLHAEFKKTNSAWDKGELIKKGQPNDPDAPKRALIGWFVRLHSICYKGEIFPGYEELEREVLSRLTTETQRHSQDEKYERLLRKMVLVNLAAQHWAGERFQADPNTPQTQQSFFYFFRFNIAVFTSLLRIFYDELKTRLVALEGEECELAVKITPLLRRILPSLRLYNLWLLSMVHMIVGLESEPFLAASTVHFWPSYAKAIDLIAQGFPIWDLDDVDEVDYMLEEDSDVLEFQPLVDDKTRKIWWNKATNSLKKLSFDSGIEKSSEDDEMLLRVKELLTDGLYLANDDETAPIHLQGTRIFAGDASNIDELVVRPIEHEPLPPKQAPKPVSYAAAAAKAQAQKVARPPVSKPIAVDDNQSRENQLKNMVDDLVDDDEGNNPVTPPQPIASHPAVLSNGEFVVEDNEHENHLAQAAKFGASMNGYATANPWAAAHRSNASLTPPMVRASPTSAAASHGRLHSVANLWDSSKSFSNSTGFANGNGMAPLSPASAAVARGVNGHANHSRVNSASSNRSTGNAQNNLQPEWNSLENSLLFGAGGGTWSNASAVPSPIGRPAANGIRQVSPTSRQGTAG